MHVQETTAAKAIENTEKVVPMIRKRIVFNGWVQGVGFRYRARHAAARLGAEEQIDGVIMAIERGRYVKIERMDVKTIPIIPDEHDFWAR